MDRKLSVLFVCYNFDPALSVGAQRIAYWAKNLSKVDNRFECDVVTAVANETMPHDGIRKLYNVKNVAKSWMSFLLKDEGITWRKSLRNFLVNNSPPYDCAVFSGGPFMHFGIAKQLKKQYNTRIILDFRDPFAKNPRFGNSAFKISVKSFFEKRFIKTADHVVSVNDECLKLLGRKSEHDKKYSVIANGYDENYIGDVTSKRSADGKIRFAYTGKFYDDASPECFLRILSERENAGIYSFWYAGIHSSTIDNFAPSANVIDKGKLNYKDALELISSCDVGVILTGGKPFESTTKIFDYIGLNKPIAIITEGTIKTGVLHTITADYPCVFWAENNETSIQNMLEEIKISNLEVDYPDRDTFSRRTGLIQLINLLT